MADIEDDDTPPALVDVSEQPILSTPTTTLDTPEQNRVPITLVTGMCHRYRMDQYELTDCF